MYIRQGDGYAAVNTRCSKRGRFSPWVPDVVGVKTELDETGHNSALMPSITGGVTTPTPEAAVPVKVTTPTPTPPVVPVVPVDDSSVRAEPLGASTRDFPSKRGGKKRKYNVSYILENIPTTINPAVGI